jgi:signal transduction histidine kinase
MGGSVRSVRVVAWLERAQDPLIALALVGGLLIESVILATPGTDDVAPPTSAAQALAALSGAALMLSLAVRRRAPLVPLGAALIATAGAVHGPLDGAVSFGAGLIAATYAAGAHSTGRSALVAASGIVGLAVVAIIRPGAPIEDVPDLASVVFLFAGPWLAGLAIRARREREVLLEQRAVRAEVDRETRAAAAVAAERARIARELHDIVAHAIGVIVVQARGARHALDADAAAAREALDAIDQTGARALADMRRLVGVLRNPGDAPLEPQPGLASLHALVGVVRDAGLAVDLRVLGAPVDLAPGIDLAAYRIVQEALTNALAHAGAVGASVTVRYGGEDVELEIVDRGRGSGPDQASGHGLVGMRERVSLYGGRLETGPRPDGGFGVRVLLPTGTP